jgi:hypothetical protein
VASSFAEMIYGTAQKTSEGMGQGIPEALVNGASLALKSEQLKQDREKLQAQNQELASAKLNKLYDYIKESRNFKEPSARNNYLKTAIGYRNTLGIDPNAISDDQITSLGYSENQAVAWRPLTLEIRAGRLTRPRGPKACNRFRVIGESYSDANRRRA